MVVRNKATSKLKYQSILSSLPLNDIGIYSRVGPLKIDIGIVNLHPFQGILWVLYTYECYFDSYGITSPNKLSELFKKRNSNCLYSDTKTRSDT